MEGHKVLRIILVLNLIQLSHSYQTIWRCAGPQTKYSYLDCERDYSYSDGCYYVEHFSQFRPCGWICNDIAFNSIDEERCRAFCPGYLTSYCLATQVTTPATSSPTYLPTTGETTSNSKLLHAQTKSSRQSSFVVWIVIGLSALFPLSGLAFSVVWFQLRRKNLSRHRQITKYGQPVESEVMRTSTLGKGQADELPVEVTENFLNKKMEGTSGFLASV